MCARAVLANKAKMARARQAKAEKLLRRKSEENAKAAQGSGAANGHAKTGKAGPPQRTGKSAAQPIAALVMYLAQWADTVSEA